LSHKSKSSKESREGKRARAGGDGGEKPRARESVVDEETKAGTDEAPPKAGAKGRHPEESAAPQEEPGHKASRKELLERLVTTNAEIVLLTEQNKELEAKAKELSDRWLRSAAEFENFRKRTAKEWELLRQQSKAEVILEILNVVDDFERAFTVAEGEGSDGFVEGFRLIYNNLTQTLERIGVKEFDALHTPFDPQYHMAVGQVERDDLESGLIAEVLQKGYQLDGVVIRPANVLVAK
jgi:molecular chaperone GrpE